MKKLTRSLLWLSFLLTLERTWPQAGISTVRGVAHDQSSAVVQFSGSHANQRGHQRQTQHLNQWGGDIRFSRSSSRTLPHHHVGPQLQNFEGALTVSVQQDAVVDGTLTLGQAVSQVDVKRYADGSTRFAHPRPRAGAATHRATADERPQLPGSAGDGPGRRFDRHSAGIRYAYQHECHAVRWHGGERDL